MRPGSCASNAGKGRWEGAERRGKGEEVEGRGKVRRRAAVEQLEFTVLCLQ